MSIIFKKGNKWCLPEKIDRWNKKKAVEDILKEINIEGDFTILDTPAYPKDRTLFKVYRTDRYVFFSIALFNSTTPFLSPEESENIEIFFDIFHDHTGFFQFIFDENELKTITHLPYPEAHSSSFKFIEVNDFKWEKEYLHADKDFIKWLFIKFSVEDIFRFKKTVGFNICRYRNSIREASSWNHCSGPGFPDATSFGHLYFENPPETVRVTEKNIGKNILFIKGTFSGKENLKFKLCEPDGEIKEVETEKNGKFWNSEIKIKKTGRYLLYPVGDNNIEPEFFYFDIPGKKNFSLSMTYDIPDNLIANFYTPSRLNEEIKLLKNYGINRIYWLDYGNFSDYWKGKKGGKNAEVSFRKCGDLLPLAVKITHREKMEFFGIFKVFDMGSNRKLYTQKDILMVKDIENKYVKVMPEIFENQNLTMGIIPELIKKTDYPVSKIKIYSEKPICNLKKDEVKIYESKNNKKYNIYQGRVSIKQKSGYFPTHRWTPAGKEKENKKRKLWVVEISDLKIKSPFFAVEIKNKNFKISNRAFLFIEVSNPNEEIPITISTGGSLKNGFVFGKSDYHWSNISEGILQKIIWEGTPLGIFSGRRKKLPTLLEPSFKETRKIWLKRIERICKSGADGVDIRILCHHNDCSDWLSYAFSEPVINEFVKRYRRKPEFKGSDYENLRRIRGEFFTDFLKNAKKLTMKYRKKLSLHFEPGIEVSPEFDTKIQIHWDWEKWIEEKIPDEIHLKYWSPQNKWVSEKILPLAKRKNIPVLVENQAIDPRTDLRGIEKSERIIRELFRVVDGYIFYETWTFFLLNPEGKPVPRGNASAVLEKAKETLKLLKGENL